MFHLPISSYNSVKMSQLKLCVQLSTILPSMRPTHIVCKVFFNEFENSFKQM